MNKLFLGSTLLLAFALCACGSSDDEGSSPPPANGGSGGGAAGSAGANPETGGAGGTAGAATGGTAGADQDAGVGGSAPEPDAGEDSSAPNPEEGILKCGSNKDVICNLPDQICCQGLSNATCKPASEKCGALTATVKCDGPEDCDSSGPLCCAKIDMASFSASVTCLSACAGTMQEAVMCHTSVDCAAPQTCKSCQPPGGPAQMMCVSNDACP